jgi:hypothetical protein
MSIFKLTQKLLRRFVLLGLALCLVACASHPTASAQNAIPMPGDAQFYGFGVFQPKEDFANVEIAQLNFGMNKTRRSWEAILPNRGSARYAGLRAYYPVDVRWKLKDGREFILEGIDTARVMHEYFKDNNFLLQHQREKREKSLGDASPTLVFGVKDDTVVIQWLLVLIQTPLDKRFPIIVNGIPSVDGTLWKTERELHLVINLKGKPVSGIDFKKTDEFLK